MTRVLLVMTMVAGTIGGVAAADLQKVMLGQWVVDEKARLEASPLYQLSTPAKKKELEKQTMGMPATRIVFKEATYNFAGGDPVPYKVLKRGASTIVLETSDKSSGSLVKDEITLEYVSDSSLKMTAKSAGITLLLNRAK